MKLKNKLLLMFLLILLIFFNFNNSFAAVSTSFESTTNGGTVTFTRTNGVWSVNGNFVDKDISYTYSVQNTLDYYIIPFITESYGRINYNYFKVPASSNYFAKCLADNYSTNYFYFSFNCNKDYYYNNDLVSANTATKIYNRSTYPMCKVYAKDSDDLLFQCPVQEVVVPALVEAKELPKVIVETLKVIIPVCLIVLGTIVVIYLVKRVIYLSR